VHIHTAVGAKQEKCAQTTEALVFPTTDGLVYFYLLGNHTGVKPQLYRLDFEVRIKALKVGTLRLYGREIEPK
jgi:hypothetical protein